MEFLLVISQKKKKKKKRKKRIAFSLKKCRVVDKKRSVELYTCEFHIYGFYILWKKCLFIRYVLVWVASHCIQLLKWKLRSHIFFAPEM